MDTTELEEDLTPVEEEHTIAEKKYLAGDDAVLRCVCPAKNGKDLTEKDVEKKKNFGLVGLYCGHFRSVKSFVI